MNQPNDPRKIYRSTRNRMIAGVAGGIAEYAHVDSAIIRIIFLALILPGGIGIVLYIIAWIIIPEEPRMGEGGRHVTSHSLADSIDDVIREIQKSVIPKMSTIGNDLSQKLKHIAEEIRQDSPHTKDMHRTAAREVDEETNRKRRHYTGGWLVVLGALLLLSTIYGWYMWEKFWPLLIILIGVGLIIRGTKNGQK